MGTGTGGEAKKRKNPHNICTDAMWETGETWAERGKHVDKIVARKQEGEHKALKS